MEKPPFSNPQTDLIAEQILQENPDVIADDMDTIQKIQQNKDLKENQENSLQDKEKWLSLNDKYSRLWPNICKKKDPLPDHKKFENETDKYDKYFSEKPGQ